MEAKVGKFKKDLQQRRTLLDPVKKEEMLAVLIRNKDAFETARDNLTVRQVKDGMGGAYALVWKVVLKLFAKFNELPPKGTLTAELHNDLTENPGQVDEDELPKVDEFVEYAFDNNEHGKDIAKSRAHYRVAIDTCKQFQIETKLLSFQENVLKDGMVPVDAVEELDRLKSELEVATSITDVDLGKPFPEGWDKRKKVRLFTTGCTVLDDFMGGGWRAKEVILFLGPYGSCKTTLVCHSVAELVKECDKVYRDRLAKWKKGGKVKRKPKRPVVVLIFTEGDKDTYRCRLLSHMAKVPWKKLMTMSSLKGLSDSKKPGSEPFVDKNHIGTEYEKKEFKEELAGGDGFHSERERVGMAVNAANKHLVIIDCTDSEDSPHRIGKGGIPELANIVRAYFRKHRDCEPMSFWIDHASALADRMSKGASDDEKLHLLLKRIPMQCADRLAKPFKAPVAIMHQLSGEANKKGITAKSSHAEAAGSTSIGEYVDFAVVTGKPDEKGLCVFRVTKHRREPPQNFKIVQVQGAFNRLVDRSGQYTVPPGGSEIVSVEDMKNYNAIAKVKGGGVVDDDDPYKKEIVG